MIDGCEEAVTCTVIGSGIWLTEAKSNFPITS